MKQGLGIRDISELPNKDEIGKIAKYLGSDVLITGSYRVNGAANQQTVEWNIHLIRTRDDESIGSIQAPGKESDLNSMVVRAGKLVRSKLSRSDATADDLPLP